MLEMLDEMLAGDEGNDIEIGIFFISLDRMTEYFTIFNDNIKL